MTRHPTTTPVPVVPDSLPAQLADFLTSRDDIRIVTEPTDGDDGTVTIQVRLNNGTALAIDITPIDI